MGNTTLKNTIIILLFLFVFVSNIIPIHSYDLFWHIKVGEHIVNEKSLPEQDLFSYTAKDNYWTLHEYPIQAILYIIDNNFGMDRLIIFKALIITLAFFILYKSINKYTYPTVLIIIIVNLLALFHSSVRPHVFFWLMLSILFYLLQKQKLNYLPILFLIWTNIHSSVLIGLFILTVYLGCKIIKSWNKKQITVLVSCFIASLINPNFYEQLLYPIRNTQFLTIIYEWHPFELTNPYFLLFLGFLLITIILILKQKQHIRIADILILITFIYLGFKSRRNVAVSAIIIAPILSYYATLLIRKSHKAKAIIKRTNTKDIALILIIIIASIFCIAQLNSLKLGINKDFYPITATYFIKNNDLKGNIFNDYNFGGYLIYNLYPENKIFIDGRIVMYGQRIFDEYYSIKWQENNYEELIEKYNIKIFIIKYESKILNYLAGSEQYKLVYFDEKALIYVRDNEDIRDLSIISPFAKPTETQKAIDGYNYLLSINPNFASGHKNLGLLYTELNNKEKARQHFEIYLKLNPKGESAEKIREFLDKE